MHQDHQNPNATECAARADAVHDDAESHSQTQTELLATINTKELRKLRARARRNGSLWFGLGAFGMIGWSVAVPAILGIACGRWLDARWPTSFSWTLTLLFFGFGIGCFNAWYWVSRQRTQIDTHFQDDRQLEQENYDD